MVKQGACILIEKEEQVINDVITSLRMLKVSVRVADSINEAKQLVEEKPPLFILCRIAADSDYTALLNYMKDLADNSAYDGIPRIAICKEEEKALLGSDLSAFLGLIQLPVEFPTFTQEVEALLNSFEKGQGVDVIEEQKEQAVEDVVVESKTATKKTALEKRMIIAYAIHMAVLDLLKEKEEFSKADASAIPKIVLSVTEEVCNNFSID